MHPASGMQPHEEALSADGPRDGHRSGDRRNTCRSTSPTGSSPTTTSRSCTTRWSSRASTSGGSTGSSEQNTTMPGLNPTWWLNYVHFTDMERGASGRCSSTAGAGSATTATRSGSPATRSLWESLAFQPYFTATAANVGYGYWSHDIGGHMRGDLVRGPPPGRRRIRTTRSSTRAGSSSARSAPSCAPTPPRTPRPSGASGRTRRRSPTRCARRPCLRYALIPYIYTAAGRRTTPAIAICRPLYYDYPEADEAYEFRDEYLFGNDMMVAPITSPASRETRLAARTVWIPPGTWIEWFTGTLLQGPAAVLARLRSTRSRCT